ncbi:natural cytotoxicity triggering receptor 3 ligand 1 isoform X2 [Apteryx rowi]|nr:natural cytotoxicity triggering receptor 3 ligand 1 isoform X2 [Apteryx rowi]
MSTKPMMFFLNTNISIPCLTSEYSTSQLDINNMRITWYLKTQDTDQEKILFTFIAGNHCPFRVGSYMLESEIKKGNAVLFLTKIQLEETGLYRCQVTVTPDDAQGTASLEVVAQPSVSLFPNEVTIESDKEKTLTCGVRKYYPHSLDIKWIKISKDNQVTTVRGEDICIEASVKNDDGTFNISSKLRVQPSLQDNGNVYRCVVNHRSLTDSILLDTTLTVTAPKLDISTLVGSVIASVVACLLLGLIAFLYIKRYKPLPPKIIPFRGSLEMKHLEETVLNYHIMGFHPKPITINFYLKHPQEKGENFLLE